MAHPTCASHGQFLPSLTDLTFPLRFLYNLMQVGLCSYMTVEAALLAYRHNYKCVCPASVVQSTERGGHATVQPCRARDALR